MEDDDVEEAVVEDTGKDWIAGAELDVEAAAVSEVEEPDEMEVINENGGARNPNGRGLD